MNEEERIWELEDQPPTYESLFGQLKEAKQTSDGSVDFCKRIIQMFAGTSKICFENLFNMASNVYLHIEVAILSYE